MRLRTRMMPVVDQGLFRHLDRAVSELASAQQLGSRMLRQASTEEDRGQRVRTLRSTLMTIEGAHRMLSQISRLPAVADTEDPDLQPEELKVPAVPVPKQPQGVQGVQR